MNALKNYILAFITPYARYTFHVSTTNTKQKRYLTKHYIFGIRVAITNDPVQWRRP